MQSETLCKGLTQQHRIRTRVFLVESPEPYLLRHCAYCRIVGLGCRAQWLRGGAADSRVREPGFESYAAVLILGQLFSFYIATVHSAV